jgi:hypothetical protein
MAQRTFAFIKLQWAACRYSHSLRRSELQLLALSAIELEPTPIGQSFAGLSFERGTAIETNEQAVPRVWKALKLVRARMMSLIGLRNSQLETVGVLRILASRYNELERRAQGRRCRHEHHYINSRATSRRGIGRLSQ